MVYFNNVLHTYGSLSMSDQNMIHSINIWRMTLVNLCKMLKNHFYEFLIHIWPTYLFILNLLNFAMLNAHIKYCTLSIIHGWIIHLWINYRSLGLLNFFQVTGIVVRNTVFHILSFTLHLYSATPSSS